MESTLHTSQAQTALQSIKRLEGKLQSVFQRVKPREHYIDKLKQQLLTKPNIYLEKKPKSSAWILIILGLFGGVIAVWLAKKFSKDQKKDQ
jgi:hypothetical protein